MELILGGFLCYHGGLLRLSFECIAFHCEKGHPKKTAIMRNTYSSSSNEKKGVDRLYKGLAKKHEKLTTIAHKLN